MGTTAADDNGGATAGLEALHRLKSTEPPHFLTKSPDLAKTARLASEYLFSSLNPHVPKSPFPRLLTQGFDAEQIWQQIDLQSKPLVSSLGRQVINFEKNPREIEKQFNFDVIEAEKDGYDGEDVPNEEFESESEEDDDDEDEEEDEEDDEDDDDDDDEEMEIGNGVEDRFLKINEMQEYLEEDEAREYGLKGKDKRKRAETEEDDEDEDDDEDDELELMGLDDNEDDEELRYEDFFGGKSAGQKKNKKRSGESHDLDMDDSYDGETAAPKKKSDELSELDDLDMDDVPSNDDDNQNTRTLSTHEKEREKLRSEIEKMEKANLEPKTWTLQGEVTAAKRPKNSALEADLDFEHNVRPAPVITEEVTATLEELIQSRVSEGRFDDVQKPPTLLNKAPREKVELDESKSKKGLAEIYEDEFAQKTGLVSTASTFSNEQKKEASLIFQKLCLKLDALSHFHFTPKPVIEDMSIQSNIPALAMEEIAPLVVSDAAMLAPEEVFAGKGDIKEETELTKEDRKRRRSKKKRKFKAESVKRMAEKAQKSTSVEQRTADQAPES